MSKFAFSLSLTATCCLGCRNVAQMEVKEAYSVSGTTALPTTFLQQICARFTPEAVPAKKGLARADEAKNNGSIIKPKPKEYLATNSINTQKDSICDSFQPLGQAKTSVSNSVNGDKYQASNVENQSKPAGALQKDEIEKGISANQSPGLPKDVWYAIATVFGAVFTYILAPIVVEIIRGRIAKHHADQTQDGFRPAAKGQPS